VAAKPLVPFTAALRGPTPIFNAQLDGLDQFEVAYPYLAEALPQLNTDTWRVFPDGKMETTYKLKPNLTWHDGTPLTADDFVFAWKVYSTPALGQATSPPISQMEEVTAPDPRTVTIRWRQPYAEASVMNEDFQALPRHILQQPFEELDPVAFSGLPFWGGEYVGLGAFRMERWEPGSFIEARAFDNYVLGKPKIERLRMVFIPDPNTALANVLANEVHYVGEYVFSDEHAATLEQQWGNMGGTILYAPTALRTTVVQLRPDYADPPALRDVRVRKAVAHAIDANLANEVLNSNRGVIAPTLTSPKVDFYAEIDRVVAKYPFDQRRTQQLMEEAGFVRGADGFFVGRDGSSFQPGVWSSSGQKNEQENAVIVDSLRKAGIDASRKVFSAAQLADAEARALIPGLSTRGQTSRPLKDYTSEQVPRPDNRWRGENRGGWSSSTYDRASELYNRALERPEQIRQIVEMNRAVNEELPVIPHWFNPSVTAHVSALKGPVARQTPDTTTGIMRIHEWEWRS